MRETVYDTDRDDIVDVTEGLRETGGPTTLTAGQVSDGEVFTRSGTTYAGEARAGIDTDATAHAASDGTSHANVVLNDAHRAGDGSDHADVATNTTHSTGDGSDHADVALNNTHRSSDGSDHTFIDQNVTTGSSPTLDGTNFTGLPAGVATGRVAEITGSDVSAVADTYEVAAVNGRQYVRLMRRTTFPEAVGDAIASPGGSRTWLNSGSLDSSDYNTTTADEWNIDHANAATDWTNGGTHTAPFAYDVFPRAYDTQEWVAFISGDGDANYNTTALMVTDDDVNNTYAYIGVGWNGADKIRTNTGGASTWTNATAGQRNGGIWFRILIDSAGSVKCYYAHGVVGTLPSGWTRTKQVVNHLASANNFKVGITSHTTNAQDGNVGDVGYMDHAAGGQSWNTAAPLYPAQQFDTGNAEQQLVADYDLGSDAPTVDQSRLRLVLADAQNLLDDDAASWTFSAVVATAGGASSAAYNAAGSVVVETDGVGPHRYLNIWAKASSDGTQPGSLLMPLTIVVE